MKVEIFTLCDAATVDAAGKLNVLGSFDRLNAATAPVVHPQCALAIKIRFQRIEEGQKRLRVTFIDQDGVGVMPSIEATSDVKIPGNDSSATITFAVNIQQLKLPRTDEEYSIDLAIDDRHEASVPLFVKRP